MPDNLDNDLDLSFLNEIADGSDEFIIESIGMFLEQTPELLDTLDSAIANQDWANAGATAHKLKPTLGFFGMNNSQALIQEVETMCKAGGENPGGVKNSFEQAKNILAGNITTLTQIKAEKEAGL